MELEEAKKILKDTMYDKLEIKLLDEAIETIIAELHAMQNLLDEKNDKLERLQKENEDLKNMDLTTVYLKGVADEKERWRNKVKKIIKENSHTDTYNFKTVEVSKLQELLGE